MRTSKKELNSAFERFCEMHGLHIGYGIGEYHLDYVAEYGGYVVETVISESGAVSRPFGSLRHSAREMYAMLHFASDVAFHARKNASTDAETAN